MVELIPVGRVEQHTFDFRPACCGGLIGQISVELVKVAGTEAKGVVVGDEGLLIVFAVEDELPIRPRDGDVGDRPLQ